MLDGYCNGSGNAYAYVKLIDEKCHYECIRLVKLYVEVKNAPYKSWDEDEEGIRRQCEEFDPLSAEEIKPVADNEFEEFNFYTREFDIEHPEYVRIKEVIEVVKDCDIEPDFETFVDEKWETYMETKAEEQMEKQWLERQGK